MERGRPGPGQAPIPFRTPLGGTDGTLPECLVAVPAARLPSPRPRAPPLKSIRAIHTCDRARKPARAACGEERPSRGGFTLLEALIGMVVLLIALVGLSAAIASSSKLIRTQAEADRARIAARTALEQIQDVPFAEAFVTFNSDPQDDPGGVGTAPGDVFVVEGLNLTVGNAGGTHGRVLMPVLPSPGGGTALELREDFADPRLGMPRDLNGDGVIDLEDHSGDYIILPMRVMVEWRSPSGNRNIELGALLSAR